MPKQQLVGGFPTARLASPINSTALSFAVQTGQGANGPSGGGSGNFVMDLDRGTAAEEKVLCSARTSDTFTVVSGGRGYDGTTQQAHSAGATVDHIFDAALVQDLNLHVYDTSRSDHSQYQPLISTLSSDLSGDVTLTNPGTYYDIVSLSLPAGTWFVRADLECAYVTAGTELFVVKLWDGTTVFRSADVNNVTGYSPAPISVGARIVLGSTTTVKASVLAAVGGASSKVLASTITFATPKASGIYAEKLA